MVVNTQQIKPIGQSVARSLKDVIKEEFSKCAVDPAYFIRRYCIIQHPQRGKILFNLYGFQEKVLSQFQKERYTVILKSRQLGISTLVGGYSLWLMLFHSDKNILVVATKQSVAKNLVTKVRIMHQNLPSWLKGNCIEDNKLSLSFSNGSQIKAESSAPEAGRSEALSLLVLDEAAFIKDIDSIWAAASLTLATGGDAIVLSTPNGVGNLFHKIWKDAEEGVAIGEKFAFNPIELHWSLHPERDQAWRDHQDTILGPRLAAQECDCSFITSGNTVIDGIIIKWYEDTRVMEPAEKRGIDHNLWIWEYPDVSKIYVVAADTARGDGSDFQAAQVIEAESATQVAEYRGMIGTSEFSDFLVALATMYGDALLVVENQNTGWAVLQRIIERQYKNLFYSSADMVTVDVESQLLRGFDMRTNQNSSKLIAGFTTSVKMRPMVISKVDEYFRNKDIVVRSKRLVTELYTWIWNNGRADHLNGYNDDTIFALGIALLVRDTALKLRQRSIELQKMTLDKFTVERPAIYTGGIRPAYNPWEMNVRGRQESLEWLVK